MAEQSIAHRGNGLEQTTLTLGQGSPTVKLPFLTLGATSRVKSHMKGNWFATLSNKITHFLTFIIINIDLHFQSIVLTHLFHLFYFLHINTD